MAELDEGGIGGLSASGMAARLRSGDLAALEVAEACLERTEARDGALRAWVHIDRAAILAQATALDALPASERGPLHGLPVGVKDVIHTRDMPTRYNSPLYADPPSTPDAACVAMLRRKGALILGKTATVEFAAVGRPAETRNPHDPGRTPGGSSSGSAAAVADGHAPLALGTQTGGSMIRPASFCGVWAMKPTWGRVSNEGCRRFAPSLDTLGWFGRSPEDLSMLLNAFDADAAPASAAPAVAGLTIGLCPTPMWEAAEADSRAAFLALAAALQRAGAGVANLQLPEGFERSPALQRTIMRAEGRISFQSEREGLQGAMRLMADGVDVASDAELVAAQDEAAALRRAFDRAAAPFDAVLTLSAVGEAPVGLASTGDLLFNGLWTLLHAPCVNMPGAVGSHGLPIGLTLAGRRYSDRAVLRAAEAIAPLL